MANAPQMTWTGQSGAAYTYYVYQLGATFTLGQPGNYIFTVRRSKPEGGYAHTAIYLGETGIGLQERFNGHEREECILRHGVTHVCVHLNTNQAAREAEEKDLRLRLDPVCNRE